MTKIDFWKKEVKNPKKRPAEVLVLGDVRLCGERCPAVGRWTREAGEVRLRKWQLGNRVPTKTRFVPTKLPFFLL